MSHEPGEDRFVSYCCAKCSHRQREELIYYEPLDEYWCESCISNEAEAAYDHQQEREAPVYDKE